MFAPAVSLHFDYINKFPFKVSKSGCNTSGVNFHQKKDWKFCLIYRRNLASTRNIYNIQFILKFLYETPFISKKALFLQCNQTTAFIFCLYPPLLHSLSLTKISICLQRCLFTERQTDIYRNIFLIISDPLKHKSAENRNSKMFPIQCYLLIEIEESIKEKKKVLKKIFIGISRIILIGHLGLHKALIQEKRYV